MGGKRILVGEFGRPHGVRGLLRLRAFTADPSDIVAYGPLSDEAGGRHFRLTLKGADLVAVDGIADRDAAQRLTGTKLYVARDALPPPDEEEYYLADLIGLSAQTQAGESLGVVTAVEDHGAGAFLMVSDASGEKLFPFTRAVVPVVDLAAGMITIDPPGEIMAPPPGKEEAA